MRNSLLHTGESQTFLQSLPNEIATLIVTSPPYNIGKEYETRHSIELHLAEQEKIIDELVRLLNTKGSLCWQVGNYVQNGEVFPLDIYYYDLFKKSNEARRGYQMWYGHRALNEEFKGGFETCGWVNRRVPCDYRKKIFCKIM
jgi:adenine-specific DNA-methyltransferase